MASLLDPNQVGWFAARQPALVRLLGANLGDSSDAFAVALDGAWRLSMVFELRDGVAPRRITEAELERSHHAAALESVSGQVLADGGAVRQPQLCRWVASYVADPPIPITAEESAAVGRQLIALLYALDEATQGRTVTHFPEL